MVGELGFAVLLWTLLLFLYCLVFWVRQIIEPNIMEVLWPGFAGIRRHSRGFLSGARALTQKINQENSLRAFSLQLIGLFIIWCYSVLLLTNEISLFFTTESKLIFTFVSFKKGLQKLACELPEEFFSNF